jgi:WD40 repeat protein
LLNSLADSSLNFTFCCPFTDNQVRVWHVFDEKKSVMVGKCRSRTGKRLHALSCAINAEGKMIAVGCSDGLIQLFKCTEKIIQPKAQIEKAHAPDSEVSCVVFSRDNRRLLSRASEFGAREGRRLRERFKVERLDTPFLTQPMAR